MDRELGFVFWLGQALEKAGYQTLPAKSIPDASALLLETNIEIDLLIVGHSMMGAVAFAAALRRSQRHLKVIVLVGQTENGAAAYPGVDAWRRKPCRVDKASIREWLDTIQGVFDGNAVTTPSGQPLNANRAREAASQHSRGQVLHFVETRWSRQ